uniref:Uncharacterized protein n=1 Tax=Panagrolaimus sp. JU765 TaxID=591449 RepID=A0AC34RHB0_9BILA
MTSNVLFGRECYGGWGYDAKTGIFISDGQMKYDFISPPKVNSSTHDFDSVTQKQHGKFVEKLFGNCRDFIEAIVNRNENAQNLIEFSMENSGTVGFISHVTVESRRSSYYVEKCFPEATHFVRRVLFGLRMLVFFDEKNADLLGDGDKKEILDRIWKQEQNLTENQENILCSVLIFSNNPSKMKKLTMREILDIILLPTNYICSLSCDLQPLPSPYYYPGKDDERFEIMTDQIFEIYWIKKSLENKIRMLSMNQLSNGVYQAEYSYDKLMPKLNAVTNFWNQKIQQCADLLAGKDVSIYDLWSTFPTAILLVIKKDLEA